MPHTRTEPFAVGIEGKLMDIPDVATLYGATITVGAEAGSNIIVSVQLTDQIGRDMAVVSCINAYLSDNADGSTVGTAHSTSPVIDTGGLLQVLITDLAWLITSESDGTFGIDFEDTSAQSIWLCLVMPNGSLVISDAITHT